MCQGAVTVNMTPLKKQARRGAIILWAAPAFLLGREKGRREAFREAGSAGDDRGKRSQALAAISSGKGNASKNCSAPWEDGEDCLEPLMHLFRLQDDMNVIASHFSHYKVEKGEHHRISSAAFALGDSRITERVIKSAHADVPSELCKAAHNMAMDIQEINSLAGLRVRGRTLKGAEEFRYSQDLSRSYRLCLEHKAQEMEELQSALEAMLENRVNYAVENLTYHREALGERGK